VTEIIKLDPEERRAVYLALLERTARDPGAAAMDSALEAARGAPELQGVFMETLKVLPLGSVPVPLPLKLRIAFGERPELAAVLERWETGPKTLKVAVQKARSG